ncbi:unnamed protein product [Angiostrongylus costaricensis]|uniref:Uncharacterized protein n=1 Tax=Angiostrongylus costaricensis TaxID=334426 RepID=A0A0R3Q2G0_ANGCS|nr:unnamed protein product [Angiostrongylus costaricensis]
MHGVHVLNNVVSHFKHDFVYVIIHHRHRMDKFAVD